jgi:radical SAM superfamily enzyme YgiQ (UPF0313 family)
MDDIAVGHKRNLAKLVRRHYTNVVIEASRGCVFNCTFCEREAFRLGHRRRVFAAERVVNELEDLSALGITDAGFVDEDYIGS